MTLSSLCADEREVIGAILDVSFAAAFFVSVFDGEEWSLVMSDDRSAVEELIGATDSTTLLFRSSAKLDDEGMPYNIGSVGLVHGNGCDVISDYTDNVAIAGLLLRANAVASRLCEARN